ncbi:MAG: Spy/CpxP family protein refolding chaperone [Gemmatimonadota bacterium]|nr:Spy/CpxP family protein refolding chaperone [Gemmatimonadota bacterium]
MERSKSFALIFLVGAFIAGGAVGITADRVLMRDKSSRGGRPSFDRMAKELELTPAQRTQFDSIATEGRTRMRELWRPLRPQMDSVQKIGRTLGDSTHEQLKRILTPDQARKLDQMRERGRKRAEARRRSDSSRHQQKPIP